MKQHLQHAYRGLRFLSNLSPLFYYPVFTFNMNPHATLSAALQGSFNLTHDTTRTCRLVIIHIRCRDSSTLRLCMNHSATADVNRYMADASAVLIKDQISRLNR